MKNLAIRKIVLKHLAELTPQETKDLLLEAQGKVDESILVSDRPQRGGTREVVLPSILAESEFDEIMEIFKSAHFLTEIY